jgi:hypothetical protein
VENIFNSVVLPDTLPGVGYSLKHKLAVEALIKYYCKRAIGKTDGNGQVFTEEDYQIMLNRGTCHDMDKILMMLSYPQLTADYYHRMYNGHHVEGFVHDNSCKYDWIEMIFDWESARYTKPDKGKCAYEVATTFNSHLFEFVKPYLQLFGFTSISNTCIKSIKDAVNKTLTEEDLTDSFLRYIHCTHLHRLEGVSRIDQKAYYQFYGRPCPLRKSIMYCSRPTSYTSQSRSLTARELIQGGIEVNAFDMDTLCTIKVDEIPKIEKVVKKKIDELGKMQR